MVKLCKFLGTAWVIIAGIIILIGHGMVWYRYGFAELQAMLSPFNTINYVVTIAVLSPGLGLLLLANWLAKRRTVAKKPDLSDGATRCRTKIV